LVKLDILILSAGKSSRMGSDKALLPINNKPSIVHLISKLIPYANSFNIVLSYNLESVKKEVEKHYPNLNVQFINNELYELGMFSSILKGLESIPGENPVLMHQIDQPFISPKVYEQLVKGYNSQCYTIQPSFLINGQKKAGHPLIINYPFRRVILRYKPEHNLKEIISEFGEKRDFVMVEDEGIFHNLNSPEQFLKKKKEHENGK